MLSEIWTRVKSFLRDNEGWWGHWLHSQCSCLTWVGEGYMLCVTWDSPLMNCMYSTPNEIPFYKHTTCNIYFVVLYYLPHPHPPPIHWVPLWLYPCIYWSSALFPFSWFPRRWFYWQTQHCDFFLSRQSIRKLLHTWMVRRNMSRLTTMICTPISLLILALVLAW